MSEESPVPPAPTVLALCVAPAQAHRAGLIVAELSLPTHAAHAPAQTAPATARQCQGMGDQARAECIKEGNRLGYART